MEDRGRGETRAHFETSDATGLTGLGGFAAVHHGRCARGKPVPADVEEEGSRQKEEGQAAKRTLRLSSWLSLEPRRRPTASRSMHRQIRGVGVDSIQSPGEVVESRRELAVRAAVECPGGP